MLLWSGWMKMQVVFLQSDFDLAKTSERVPYINTSIYHTTYHHCICMLIRFVCGQLHLDSIAWDGCSNFAMYLIFGPTTYMKYRSTKGVFGAFWVKWVQQLKTIWWILLGKSTTWILRIFKYWHVVSLLCYAQ